MRSFWLVLVAGLLSAPAAAGVLNDADTQTQAALGQSRQALGNTLPALSFTNTDGERVELADYRGKPLLVNLVYTGCTDVCPAIIEHLYPGVEESQEIFGEDAFSVVTIGFDTAEDTPQRMRSFARQQGVDLPNWHFLSAEREAITRLTEAVGFAIEPSAGGFAHMAQVSIIDGEGKVYQQIYGGVFAVPAVVEPLKDLIYGRTKSVSGFSDVIDRIKLFCTVYNPNTGAYYFDYSLIIGIVIGAACLTLVFFWLLGEVRRSRRTLKG